MDSRDRVTVVLTTVAIVSSAAGAWVRFGVGLGLLALGAGCALVARSLGRR